MSRLTRRGLLSGGSKITATLSPTSLTGVGTGASVNTSGTASIAASNGSGTYTYAWDRISGSTGINAASPAGQTTAFSATGLAVDEVRNAVFRGLATDAVTGAQAFTDNTVSVQLSRALSALSASLSPNNLSGSSTGSTVTTSGSVSVSVSGGSGSYTYAWERVSGSTTPAPNSPTAATTSFSTSSISQGSTQSTVWRCIVTDTVTSNTAPTGNVSISLTRDYATLTVSAAPGSLSASGNTSTVTTAGTATATVSGGSGSWTGVWEWDGLSSTGSVAAVNPTNATSAFRSGDSQAQGTTRTMGLRYRVTDSVTGLQASSNSVNVTLTRYAVLSATASPSDLSGTSPNTPVVTSGAATCSVSGGSGSYTYLWEWDGGSATGAIDPTTPTSPTTTFYSGDAQASGTTRGAGMRCRVTDTVTGSFVNTNSVGVVLTRTAADVAPSGANITAGTLVLVGGLYQASVSVSVAAGTPPLSYMWEDDGVTGGYFADPTQASTTYYSPSPLSQSIGCTVSNAVGSDFASTTVSA